jgi:hypothetical protein
MPRISHFYGIAIRMYWNERDHPIPHFHAEYGAYRAAVAIDGSILAGELPAPCRRLIDEWAAIHEAELQSNWVRARNHETLDAIAPLA